MLKGVLHVFHKHSYEITCLLWSTLTSLYAADKKGYVYKLEIDRIYKQITLYNAENEIIQIQKSKDSLLISSLKRCYLIKFNQKQILQIGKKLRNGPYGVIYHQYENTFYSARPGKRLWLVDSNNGQVLSTLKMKLPPPLSLTPYSSAYSTDDVPNYNAKIIQFYQLKRFEHNILAYGSTSPGLLFINTDKVTIERWFDSLGYISDLNVIKAVNISDHLARIYFLHHQQLDQPLQLSCITLLTPLSYIQDELHFYPSNSLLQLQQQQYSVSAGQVEEVIDIPAKNILACIHTVIHFHITDYHTLHRLYQQWLHLKQTSPQICQSMPIDLIENFNILYQQIQQEEQARQLKQNIKKKKKNKLNM